MAELHVGFLADPRPETATTYHVAGDVRECVHHRGGPAPCLPRPQAIPHEIPGRHVCQRNKLDVSRGGGGKIIFAFSSVYRGVKFSCTH